MRVHSPIGPHRAELTDGAVEVRSSHRQNGRAMHSDSLHPGRGHWSAQTPACSLPAVPTESGGCRSALQAMRGRAR